MFKRLLCNVSIESFDIYPHFVIISSLYLCSLHSWITFVNLVKFMFVIIPLFLTKGEEEKLRRFERKIYESSGMSLPKTDELRGPGKVARREHCENYKDTEAAMVRPHEKDR